MPSSGSSSIDKSEENSIDLPIQIRQRNGKWKTIARAEHNYIADLIAEINEISGKEVMRLGKK